MGSMLETLRETLRNKLSCALLGHEWVGTGNAERYVCARCDRVPGDYAEVILARKAVTSRRETHQDNGDCS